MKIENVSYSLNCKNGLYIVFDNVRIDKYHTGNKDILFFNGNVLTTIIDYADFKNHFIYSRSCRRFGDLVKIFEEV